MPRKTRFDIPGIPQHVIQRGNNREPCFFAEADYQRYLSEYVRQEVFLCDPRVCVDDESRSSAGDE